MSRLLILPAVLALMGGALALGGAAAQEEGVTLSSMNDSGVSGSVMLTPSGQQTIVDLTTQGSDAGSNHPAHIHLGVDCANIGAIDVSLTDVTVGADAMGSSTTTADVPITGLQDGNHVVAVHRGPTLQVDPTIIACGPLPVSISSPPPAAEEPAPAAEETTMMPAPTGSGGLLDQGSGGIPTLPFILLGVGAALLGAGAVGWRLRRTGR